MDKKTGPLDDAKLDQVSGGASQEEIEEFLSSRRVVVNKPDNSALYDLARGSDRVRDDSALDLAIREKMKGEIKGLHQESTNSIDPLLLIPSFPDPLPR